MTIEEKNEIVKKMRAFHEETMNRLSKGEKHYFYPKVPFLRTNGLRVIGMFRSELEKPDENVYIETINLNYEALDKRRTLYRLRYNPYFKEEYEHLGNDHYNVPMEELDVVWQLPEDGPMAMSIEIIEGNKLIALFMGKEVTEDKKEMLFSDKELFFPESLMYHLSWDWLMPVVEKIEVLECVADVSIVYKNCVIFIRDEFKNISGKLTNMVSQQTQTTKIEAVWLTVVEFITWYNTTGM